MAYDVGKADFRITKVISTATYTENQPFSLKLIQGINITYLKLRLKMNYTTNDTSAPTAIEDGVAKLVKNLRLQYDGGAKTPIRVINLQQLNLYSQHLRQGRLANDQPPEATGETGTKYVDAVIVPSLSTDKQDPRYCIPGEVVSGVEIVGTWGNAADVWVDGANATINSATLEVTMEAGWSFGPEEEELRRALAVDDQGNVYMPLWQTRSVQWNGAYDGLGFAIELPTDVIIRKIFIVAKDSNAKRSDSVISEVAVRAADNVDVYGVLDWTVAQKQKAEELEMNPVTGCLLIDCVEDIRDRRFAIAKAGLVTTKVGKLYLRFSTTAAGSADLLFDCIRKVKILEAAKAK